MADNLMGTASNDEFDGQGGGDTLTGGGGYDIYNFDFNLYDGADTIIDDGGEIVFNVISDISSLTFLLDDDGNAVIKSGDDDSVKLTGDGTTADFDFEIKDNNGDVIATIARAGTSMMGTDLDGSAGNDVLFGAEGDNVDTIDGQGGDDILIGGGGVDTYVFSSGDGADTIIDDGGVLQFKSIAEGAGIDSLTFSIDGSGNAVISYGSSDSVTIVSTVEMEDEAGKFNFKIKDKSGAVIANIIKTREGGGYLSLEDTYPNIVIGNSGVRYHGERWSLR